MTAAKKSFKDVINPAMQFISQPVIEETPQEKKQESQTPTLPPKGYKYIESRSKRLQLLIQPSLFEKVKAIAQSENKSVNDFIHTLLESEVEKRG